MSNCMFKILKLFVGILMDWLALSRTTQPRMSLSVRTLYWRLTRMSVNGVAVDAHLTHLQIWPQVVINIFVLIFFHFYFSHFQVDFMFWRIFHFLFIGENLFNRLAYGDLPGFPGSFFIGSLSRKLCHRAHLNLHGNLQIIFERVHRQSLAVPWFFDRGCWMILFIGWR